LHHGQLGEGVKRFIFGLGQQAPGSSSDATCDLSVGVGDAAENRRSHPGNASNDGRNAPGDAAQTPEKLVAVLRPQRIGHFFFEFLEAFSFLELLFRLGAQKASQRASEEAILLKTLGLFLEPLGLLLKTLFLLFEALGLLLETFRFFLKLFEALGFSFGLVESEFVVKVCFCHRSSPFE
jgi:hypothetical protein